MYGIVLADETVPLEAAFGSSAAVFFKASSVRRTSSSGRGARGALSGDVVTKDNEKQSSSRR